VRVRRPAPGRLRCQDHSPATTQATRHSGVHTARFKGTPHAACADPHIILADRVFMMLKQVYRLEGLDGAKCVQRLDDSQIVQIALRFAFHCVLHRCKSLEIHC
jgi:hypothetical protein